MNQQETIIIGGSAKPADPQIASFMLALALFVIGSALGVAGVYLLLGSGFALVMAAVPFLVVAFGLFRGVTRGG